MDQQLASIIAEKRSKGAGDQQARSKLVGAGWPQERIERV